ncbi:MAG: hypothetical protein ABIK68_17395, partial [bacterium]
MTNRRLRSLFLVMILCLLVTVIPNLVRAEKPETISKPALLSDEAWNGTKTHPVIHQAKGNKSVFESRGLGIVLIMGPALFSGILLLVLWWNRSLKKQVTVQTESLERELSERKLAEEALRDSKEMVRELTQSSNSIILKFNQDFQITFVNRFAQ